MAILVDLNQVMISSVLAQANPKQSLEEDLIRHIALNSIRANAKKFKSEYGNLILCCDSRTYWRKQVFPHYKAHRKAAREKSPLDWNLIFKALNGIKQDLKDHFPYKVIEVDGAEADDVIGTLTPRLSAHEKILILSSDKDFVQLQKYPNVKQYNPMLGVYVTSKNPVKDLKEKIIRGDSGDGIPSIMNEDGVFVEGIRQKPLSTKKLVEWLDQEPKTILAEELYRNYVRNDMLINFDNIPIDIKNRIIEEYDTNKPKSKKCLYKYFLDKKLINLLEVIEEF
nr:MAG: ribonuclease H [Caudoviricetes sp.]